MVKLCVFSCHLHFLTILSITVWKFKFIVESVVCVSILWFCPRSMCKIQFTSYWSNKLYQFGSIFQNHAVLIERIDIVNKNKEWNLIKRQNHWCNHTILVKYTNACASLDYSSGFLLSIIYSFKFSFIETEKTNLFIFSIFR